MANRHKIHIDSTDHRNLLPAADLLLAGGVIAGPTQTFYGLMAAADKPEALARIQRLKGRDGRKPLLLLLDRPERVYCYVREVNQTAEELMGRFWPGPLTLLLKALPDINEALVGPDGLVGVRVEQLPAIRTLVRAIDRGVTGTSANTTGHPPAARPREVEAYFGGRIDLILDGGRCAGGQPSTIVDASTSTPRLIRAGCLDPVQLKRAVPNIVT